MSEKEKMKSYMVKELASLLMEGDKTLSIEEALSLVFNSDTYQKLLNDSTRLYFQSPRYVYSYLETELKTGKIG